MQIVTRKHLDEFLQAVAETGRRSLELKKQCLDSMTVVHHNAAAGNLDGAEVFGLQAMLVLEAEMEDMFTRIEKPAFNLLGETRKPIETARGFFDRIGAMDEAQMQATMQRNGCVWKGGMA